MRGMEQWPFDWPSPQSVLRSLQGGVPRSKLAREVMETIFRDHEIIQFAGNRWCKAQLTRLLGEIDARCRGQGYSNERWVNYLFTEPIGVATCVGSELHTIELSLLTGAPSFEVLPEREGLPPPHSRSVPWVVCQDHNELPCFRCRTPRRTIDNLYYRSSAVSFVVVCEGCKTANLSTQKPTLARPQGKQWAKMRHTLLNPGRITVVPPVDELRITLSGEEDGN